MNAIKLLTVATTTAAIFTTSLAFSQDCKAPPPPESPDAPPNAAEALPPPPPPPPVPDLEPIVRDVRKQVQLARDQAAQALAAAGDVITETFVGPEGNFLQRGGARPGRSIIVPSAEMEPDSMATATEELNIMARIFEKALPGGRGDKPDRRAMGIAIFSSGGGSPIRNFYVEGYGALFVLDVPFPLLPPPKKEEQGKPKEPTSSAWEEARDELYNPRGPRGEGGFAWKGFSRGEPEEYDAGQVEELKESLLDAFRHATHIHAVKPEEWVTVVVNGGGPGRLGVVRTVRGGGGGGGGHVGGDTREFRTEIRRESRAEAGATMRRGPGQGESTMMIRARKSDVDAFAKGTLDLDGFKKKATVRVY